jgi:hypothetical protein
VRRIYDLRHTFATFALRAGISTFDLSRYGMPSCVAKQVTPIRNREAPVTEPQRQASNMTAMDSTE